MWLVYVYCNFIIIIPCSMIPIYMVELVEVFIVLAVCRVSLGFFFVCLDYMCCPIGMLALVPKSYFWCQLLVGVSFCDLLNLPEK